MADVCNSVTVTEFPGKPGKWNAINPASEKPKFGRGTYKPEMKIAADISKEDAIAAGKAAVADKLTGQIVKEIYVPGRLVNIVQKG